MSESDNKKLDTETPERGVKRPIYWIGDAPKQCDVCDAPITERFIDGAMRYGSWANMCPKCHRELGRGFGMGAGQQYDKQPDGKWLKTKG